MFILVTPSKVTFLSSPTCGVKFDPALDGGIRSTCMEFISPTACWFAIIARLSLVAHARILKKYGLD